jgi:PAS domain S-box-containing protein
MTSSDRDARPLQTGPSLLDSAPRVPDAASEAVFDALPAQVAVLDARGIIVSVNAAWREFAATNGLQAAQHGVGLDYLALCEQPATAARDSRWSALPSEGQRVAEGIRAVLAGDSAHFTFEYACHSAPQELWFELRATPLWQSGRRSGAVVMHVDVSQRKRTSSQLARLSLETERRERMFSTILASISDLTYVLDRQARVLYASQPTLDLWGLSLEAAQGRTAAEIGYPIELAQRVDAQVQWVFDNGRTLKDETPFLGCDGTQGYYEYDFAPAFAPDGKVEFVVGCSREVTERRRAEEALKESVAEFRTLAAAMPQIVCASTATGDLVYLNTQWVEYTGRPLVGSLGLGWMESLHPDDLPRVAASLREALRTGLGCSEEARLRRADGAYRWWLLRCVPVRDEAGGIVKWIGTCTDIDELKLAQSRVSRANEGLQRQRGELRALFDLVPALVWVKDIEGRVVHINQRAASHMGLSVADAIGHHITQLLPELGEENAQEDQQILRTGEPLLGKVHPSVTADGRECWFRSDKVPYRDGNGGIMGIMVMRHDVTEHKRVQQSLHELNASLENRVRERTAELALARDEAEQANEAKSVFLATMSHEIRTPMSGLLGLLELLDLSALDPEQRSTLAVARESGRALQQIIDGILDFAKIEANSLELDITPGSVKDVVEGACRLHGPVASGKNLTLTYFVAPDIRPALLFDPLRLGQILNNLVGNAIKFTERGCVHVQLDLVHSTPEQDHLRLTVTDTGIGIPPDRVPHLFQPFVQADASTSTRFGGTGLGLFIARSLAVLMGGELTLDSAPGQGTRIMLRVALDACKDSSHDELPARAARGRLDALLAGRPAAPSVTEAAARGTLLLIVDDHPINRMVLLRQVSTLGYAAEAAADGLHALKAWESGRFAAVITDCNMPRMSGYELAAAIRAREAASASPRMPVIGCTANALASAAQACLDAGMDDSITKPVALEEICAKLDRWMPQADGSRAEVAAQAPARRPAVASGEGLLDHALLAEISGGDPQAFLQVLADFRRSNESDSRSLRAAVAATDFAQAMQLSHRVRGACAMLGASQLATASASVQAAAGERDLPRLRAAMETFEREMLRLNKHLEFLASRGTKDELAP